MSGFFSDPATGWSFECDTAPKDDPTSDVEHPPRGGLVLRYIRHRGNNFARSMRLIGMRLTVAEVDPSGAVTKRSSQFALLDPATFTVGAIQELSPSPVSAPALGSAPGSFLDRLKGAVDEMLLLESYFKDGKGNYSGYGLRADYLSNERLLSRWPNCDMSGLEISQIFLFSSYGNSPPHEPSKALLAAGCHPMTIFSLIPNPAVDRSRAFQRIESIRFDYRLHLAIDSIPAAGAARPPPRFNMAGLFRDNDSLSLIGAASGLVLHLSRSQAVTNAAFGAAEKQVILEVAAPGTAKGFSGVQEGDGVEHWCWDNIHWWGSRANEQMISAPGAFHAAHVHWRWGAAATPIFSSIPVVEGTGTGTTSGTLLVDPRIWIQSIRVAVTENDSLLDPDRPGVAPEGLCKVDWKSLFTGLRAVPREIAAGADIVCWYSAEVHRDVTVPTERPGVTLGRGPLPETVGPLAAARPGSNLRQSPAEALAQKLLWELPLPKGAVNVRSEPGFNGPGQQVGCGPLVDVDRYWHVPGEPKVVMAWILSHRPSGSLSSSRGEGGKVGVGITKWFGAFQFAVKEPSVIRNAELVFEAVAAKGGGTALRADAPVVPAGASCVHHG